MSLSKALLMFASAMGKSSIDAYVDLEMPIDNYTFVTKNGALITLFRIDGMLNIPLSTSALKAFNQVEKLFKLVLKDKAHKISWCYEQDNKRTAGDIRKLMAGDARTAKALDLDVIDVLKEIVEVNQEDGLFQQGYLTLYTDHSAESDSVVVKDREKKSKAYKDMGTTQGTAPDAFSLLSSILTKHNGKIEEIKKTLSQSAIKYKLLDCRESCTVIAKMLDPKVNNENFNVVLPYDITNHDKAKWHKTYTARKPYPYCPIEQLGDYTPDRLTKQLITQTATEVADGILKIGSSYMAPIYVQSFPRADVLFAELLNEIGKEIPFRVNFLMGNAKNAWLDVKKIIASLSRWGHPDNKNFIAAGNTRSIRENDNETYCSLQILFCTWADSLDDVIRFREQLLTSIQKWEGCYAKSDMGDTMETYVATIPGAAMIAPSPVGFPPVESLVNMLPVTTEARCWDRGSLLFRTLVNNVVTPFEPLAKNQDYHLDVILARPRQGKGVLSNSINFALLLKSGNKSFPYETFVDVGPTSTGYGRFIQDSLPENKKDLVVMLKLSADGDYVNPADIQLGLDCPLPEEKGFLSNFLMMVCTDPSSKTIPSNIAGMIGTIIEETYKEKFSYKTGNIYNPYVNLELDEAIKDAQKSGTLTLEIDEFTKYFEIRDALFQAGDIKMAKFCHIQAMPLLGDFREVASSSSSIARDYGALPAIGSTMLPDFFALKMKETINQYSIFERHTKNDFDSARITIIDVKPMIDTSNDVGIVQTGIFMLLARFIGCKDFILNEDHVQRFNPIYREYQKKRIMDIRSTPKRVTYDELHTSNGCAAFRDQLAFDVKEGPKWNTSICVISHEPLDFGPLLTQCTNLFILGDLPTKFVRQIDEILGLSNEAKHVFGSGMLHGPQKGGSCFLLRTILTSGTFEQVYRFPKGAMELWSYTTEKRDMPLRDRLIEKIGTKDARKLLSKIFSDGTANKWFYAQEKKDEAENKFLPPEEGDTNLVDQLERELMTSYTSELLKVES
jgi:intracellular multiplication protein IcmB